jgi:hypothetical protein
MGKGRGGFSMRRETLASECPVYREMKSGGKDPSVSST